MSPPRPELHKLRHQTEFPISVRARGDEAKGLVFGRGSWIRTNDLQYPKLKQVAFTTFQMISFWPEALAPQAQIDSYRFRWVHCVAGLLDPFWTQIKFAVRHGLRVGHRGSTWQFSELP